MGRAEGPEILRTVPEREDRTMEDLARSACMQNFYGDMDSWLLVSLLLLAAGIYRELVVLPARRAEYERDTVCSHRLHS